MSKQLELNDGEQALFDAISRQVDHYGAEFEMSIPSVLKAISAFLHHTISHTEFFFSRS